METRYDPSVTLREARALLFASTGISKASYEQPFTRLRLGALLVPVPNVLGLARATVMHDLHRVVTEFGSGPAGEGALATWELSSGSTRNWLLKLSNLSSLLTGLLYDPRGMYQACAQGLNSRSLDALNLSAGLSQLLDQRVAQLRLSLQSTASPASAAEVRAMFVGLCVAAVMWNLLTLAVVLGPLVLGMLRFATPLL